MIATCATAFSCSSSTAPDQLPTVLVTNATCEAGRCATLEVRAYIWKFKIPYPPWGEEVLGEAPPGQTCLRFPPSWTARIIGDTIVNDTASGHLDTVVVTWTPDDTVPIYLIAVDSVVFHSRDDTAQVRGVSYFDGLVPASVGETPNFAPGASPGWKVTFPSAPLWSATPIPAEACEP